MTVNIADRMKDYFIRQIACYEETIAAYHTLSSSGGTQDVAAALSRHSALAGRAKALEMELRALLPEWNSSKEVTAAERTEIQELAQRTEVMARRLKEQNDASLQQVYKHMERIREDLGRIRRGRNTARRYRQSDDHASFVDRKA